MTSTASRPVRGGFTLLEMLAVVSLIALVMAFVVPNLGATRSAVLRGDAGKVAATLEMARQRAVMTRKAHRLLVNVDEGGYRLEWFVNDGEAAGIQGEIEPAPLDLRGETPLPMAAPVGTLREYRPVPTRFGRREWLAEGLAFDGVDTPEGWLDGGDVGLVFTQDGSTDAAKLVISDPDGRTVTLEVHPLLDVVRIREGDGDD